MTAPSDASPARAKSSIADKLAALSGFGLVFAALSALGSGFENTADGYLRTISIAAL